MIVFLIRTIIVCYYLFSLNWIHTRNNQIKGYWWCDNDVAEYEDNLGLDEACEEWFNSTIGAK